MVNKYHDRLRVRVWDRHGALRAVMLDFSDAAALVAALGAGAMVSFGRTRGQIVWIEGREDMPAADSYDAAAETMVERTMRQAWRRPDDMR